jgi:hypothetical protein
MKIIEIKLTPVECGHLITLLMERKEDGSYYGNQKQYYNRTNKLLNILGYEEENENN